MPLSFTSFKPIYIHQPSLVIAPAGASNIALGKMIFADTGDVLSIADPANDKDPAGIAINAFDSGNTGQAIGSGSILQDVTLSLTPFDVYFMDPNGDLELAAAAGIPVTTKMVQCAIVVEPDKLLIQIVRTGYVK